MILTVDSFHTLSKMSHGDLKPDNMVITDNSELALIDFAHSERFEEILIVATGTEGYSPPEFDSKILESYSGEKADMWCLGVCLWIGLTS